MALWEQWRKEQLEKNKPVEEPAEHRLPKEPIVYRDITDQEAKALLMLNICTLFPGSGTKRFIKNMQGATKLSEKQATFLHWIFYRYRRQMKLSDEAARCFFD